MNRTYDSTYLGILLNPLDECARHKPAFGRNDPKGVDIVQFRKLYGDDPLYRWIGLDSDLMYAAHKAAGGMTSIYRQLGIGCERLLRQIIMDYSKSNINSLNGAVFEIRQGYKSADSKRQNADLRFGMRARSDDDLLPVIMIVSTQVNKNVFQRYRDQRIHIMIGILKGDNSTYDFFSDVIGYDLADFFHRNSAIIQKRFETIIKQLLTP